MANKLHKLGIYTYTHPWQVIIGWLVVLAILGGLAFHFMKPTSSAISIPGTKAQETIDRVSELFPEAGKGSGRIVFASKDATIDQYSDRITKVVNDVKAVPGVKRVISPSENAAAISSDKKIAYIQIQLNNQNGEVSEETTTKIENVATNARGQGLQVEMGGDIISKVPADILGVGEVAGVVIALLVLVVTLGSLIAAGMPLVTALVAVGASMAGLFALSQVITIGATTPVLAVMLGLAVGIDYSLFIINKYRTIVMQGIDHKKAIGMTIGTAGNAVVFAAATVVIALASLSIVSIPFMTTMGLAGAATIAIAAIVAVTLIPALLSIAGKRIFGRKTRRTLEVSSHKPVVQMTFWSRWAALLTKYPAVWLVLGMILMVVVAIPAKDLKLGLPTDEYAAKTTTERKAYDLLSKGFGAGFNGPLIVLAEGLPAVSDVDKAAVRTPLMTQYEEQVAAAENAFQQKAAAASTAEQQVAIQQEIAAAQASAPAQKAQALAKIDQAVEQYSRLVQLKKVADSIASLKNVDQALPAMATDDGTKGIIQITPKSAPADAKTTELIVYLRDPARGSDLTNNKNVTVSVSGSTALQNDINDKLGAALPLYLGVVVGLSLLLLIVAFRSILVPIKATLGFLLSVLAMFGALVAVFQWGWFGISDAPGPIVSFIPIIAIGILFGLAMDYEFFLVSSMHESYQHTKDAKVAVRQGFSIGSKVVTAAAVIMVAVFAGFIFNHDITIQAIGFGLAVGILFDAFVVRMTIVPAVMSLLGRSAWWIPEWLDRILPHVSIEGESEKS